MASPSIRLIQALRTTADRLSDPQVTYRWSHFAHCNCGHLVQTITGLAPRDVQQRASGQSGDWGEQAEAHARMHQLPATPDYGDRPALDEGAWEPENIGACTVSGTPLDLIFEQLADLGMSADDIGHLERLSDPEVRGRLGKNTVVFLHFERQNVISYLTAWAELLEEKLDILESHLPLDTAAE